MRAKIGSKRRRYGVAEPTMLEAKKHPDRFNFPASFQKCSPHYMAVPSRMAVFQRTGIPISGAMRRSDFEWSGMFSFFRFKTPKPAPSSTDGLNTGMALSRASIRSCSSMPRQMATPAWGPAMHPANLDSMEAASFSSTRDTLGSPNEKQ